ncbi:MAG: glycosyltransferase family 2 protein [Opitutales bacterium]
MVPADPQMPAPSPRISFVTALYNRLELTRAFLNSLEETVRGIPFEIILIDDGSTDGTRRYLETLEDQTHVQVVLNETNRGFAYNNNLGARLAQADTLCLLNNDLVLTPGWLEPMLEQFDTLPQIGVLGNIQYNARTGLIDHAGVFFDQNGQPAHARKNRKKIPRGPWKEWFAVTAACVLVRKQVFEELGGFDDSYRNGMEDIDFCVRLKQAGYRNYVCNLSKIYHHVSSSPGRLEYNDSNMRLFLKRWSHLTSRWGTSEWAAEYLSRNARQLWRFNLKKLFLAFWMLARRPFSRNAGSSGGDR